MDLVSDPQNFHGVSSEVSGKHYIMKGPVLKIHQLRYADETILSDETKYIPKVVPKINMASTDVSHLKSIKKNTI